MKKVYFEPIIEVSTFDIDDIITASIVESTIPGNEEIYSPIYWEDEIGFGNR